MATALTQDEIVTLVRDIVNQYQSTSSDFDTEINDQIAAQIPGALRIVASIAPVHMLKATTINTGTSKTRPDGRYYYTVAQPSDMVRFVSASRTDWKKDITELLNGDPGSSRIKEFGVTKGVGSGDYYPKAYSVSGNIEMHSGDDDSFPTIKYIGDQTITGVSPSLKELIAYQTAGMYLGSIGDSNAQAVISIANNFVAVLNGFAQAHEEQPVQQ